MSSSRTSPQSPRRGRGGGVQVRTVVRSTPTSSTRSGRGNSRGSSTNPRSRSRSHPSARYRQALKKRSASSHGGDFVKDDEIARQFANRVVEIYAPSTNAGTESVRQLPLIVQARRDGRSFKLPTLAQMCLSIIAQSFESHILPIRFMTKDGNYGDSVMKEIKSSSSSRGLLGIDVGGYDEEKDQDYLPDSDGESKRPPLKKVKTEQKRIARKSETQALQRKVEFDEVRKEKDMQLLELLPTSFTIALQEQLERKAPQLLNYNVMAQLFLSRIKVSRSKLFRVLAIVNGINERDMIKVWQQLIYENSLLPTHTIKKAIPDNAANSLRTLHLQAFTQLKTNQIIDLFKHTRRLENVCLRGCVNIYSEAIAKLVETCGETLRSVNLNWTSIGLTGVEHLIRDAPNLEVLKVAHVKGLNDSAVKAMMARIMTNAKGSVPLGKLERLKLHGTEIGIQGLAALLEHCGKQIKTLDIGNTRVAGAETMEILLMLLGYEGCPVEESDSLLKAAAPGNMILEKINLAHLNISISSALYFVEAFVRCKRLRKVNLDYLGALSGFSAASSLPAFVGAFFGAIACKALERRVYKDYQPDEEYIMDSVSLALPASSTVANEVRIEQFCRPPKRGNVDLPLNDKVIRSLNLTGFSFRSTPFSIPATDSYIASIKFIESQFAVDGSSEFADKLSCTTFEVQHLNLSGCRLPQQFQWPWLGISGNLRSINLSNSNIDSDSIDDLVRTNPYLERMELTGCRSIPVTKRRNYFGDSL